MSLRDELIEVAAMALAEPYLGAVRHPSGVMHEPWRGLVPAATAALDAILARLGEPSEEMISAYVDRSIAIFETCFGPPNSAEHLQQRRDANAESARELLRILLSTLEPKT
jgi:hypothetical protein